MSVFTDTEKQRSGQRQGKALGQGKALATIEAVIARLLTGGSAARRTAGICGHCGAGELRVLSSHREAMMGELGPLLDDVECDNAACSHSETRLRRYSATVG